MSAKSHLIKIAHEAGITINGRNPWDIQVHDDEVYSRIFRSGRLALGESYMDQQWDCKDLSIATSKLIQSGAQNKLRSLSTLWLNFKSRIFNLQNKSRSHHVGEYHYDIGNDFYEVMLTGHMQYTCDLWRTGASNLIEAQEAKMDLICKKLDLKAGKRLLDVGCGWGGLMKYAAEKYGVECVGISVSKEQTKWAEESFKDLPCKIQVVDYRDFEDLEGFDYITSIEMIEAVGPKNYREYFKKMNSLLKKDGKILLQAIVSNINKSKAEPWFDKYIFPNGIFPSANQIQKNTHGLFVWEHLENIGLDYEKTLLSWWNNLEKGYSTLNKRNPTKYNERFLRMFRYYLLTMAGNAKAEGMYNWQLVMTKKNNELV